MNLPDGVISESVSDSSAQLVIDSKTVGGHEIKYRATTEKGKTKEDWGIVKLTVDIFNRTMKSEVFSNACEVNKL